MNKRFYCIVITLFSMTSLVLLQTESNNDEMTFTLEQERALSEHPRVLSFLFFMTRKKFTLEETAQQYNISSFSQYRDFLLRHKIIDVDGNLLFKNPYSKWAIRYNSEAPIQQMLRGNVFRNLQQRLARTNANIKDTSSPTCLTPTFRLTPEEFQHYKQAVLALHNEYMRRSLHNLTHNIPHQAVWGMFVADVIESEIAERQHPLFGEINEFE